MSIDDLTKKIEKLQKEIETLEIKKRRFESLPVEQKIAEVLHTKFCNFNHVDGCDWEYCSWTKKGHAHDRWEKKAKEVYAVCFNFGKDCIAKEPVDIDAEKFIYKLLETL